jgi:hypothetical protein
VPFFRDIGDREREWHLRAATKLVAELAQAIDGARAEGDTLVVSVGGDRATVTVDLTGVFPEFRIATAMLPPDAITIDGADMTGDAVLVKLWIDEVVQSTLVDGARWTVGAGEVVAQPGSRDPSHLARVVEAAAAIATRPARITRALAEIAPGVGGGPYRT